MILEDVLLSGGKSCVPFVWFSREYLRTWGVVKEVLFDHQGHIKSLKNSVSIESLKSLVDNKTRQKVSLWGTGQFEDTVNEKERAAEE